MVLLGGFIGTLIGYLIAHRTVQKERALIRKRLLIQKLQQERMAILVDQLTEIMRAARKPD